MSLLGAIVHRIGMATAATAGSLLRRLDHRLGAGFTVGCATGLLFGMLLARSM
jgi:hypothetical protein